MVCLEDCEDVVGSAWLHPRSSTTAAEKDDDGATEQTDGCAVSSCAACLKTYFTVSSGKLCLFERTEQATPSRF